jgi:hypothetical protein
VGEKSEVMIVKMRISYIILLIGLMPTVAHAQDHLPPCPNGSYWNYCHGTYTFPSGKQYVGEFKADLANGKGTLTFADGAKYIGEFKDGAENGQGILTFADGAKYVGEFKGGSQDGQGTLTYASGNKYVGEFKEGKRSGKGSYTFINGNKYVGEFKDGAQDGQGTFTYSDGTKYVGEFKSGKRNGKGELFAADGSVISWGTWSNDNFLRELADQNAIKMEESGGVYVVPVRFNNSLTLDAIVDSGATDVSIPADVILVLMRTKTVTQADFLGQQTYVLADGSMVPSQQLLIRSIKVGSITVENVVASIASVNGSILLGQSFLRKFRSWSIDNDQHVLVLK